MPAQQGNNLSISQIRDGLINPNFTTPLYASANSFTVAGDVTSWLRPGRGLVITFQTSGIKRCVATSLSYNSETNKTTINTTGDRLVNETITSAEISLSDQEAMYNAVVDPPFVYDVDGNKYCTVRIGRQLWMAQNLRVTHKPNGEALTSYLYPDQDEEKVGRLYTWDVMMNGDGEGGRGIAPEGWHIPTDAEWKELERYLGMKQSQVDADGHRGTNEGKMLKSLDKLGDTETNGLNTVGFNGLLGGYRNTDSSFNNLSSNGYFWSSSQRSSTSAWERELYSGYTAVGRYNNNKAYGFSVRCLKD